MLFIAIGCKEEGGGKKKEIENERKKRKKKRIRRLGATEMCNVKHHRCQLWAVEPGLSPIHKSRSLGRLAGRVWIGRGVVAGPPDAGAGGGGRPASRKSTRQHRTRAKLSPEAG